MRVYVGKMSHLFHKIPHIRDNICIKSVTFGPSHFTDLCNLADKKENHA